MSRTQPVEPALEFLIGRDAHGHWLAIETHGLPGGFFNSADAAFRYVSADFHQQTKRVELVDDIIDPFGKTCVEIASRYRHHTPAG